MPRSLRLPDPRLMVARILHLDALRAASGERDPAGWYERTARGLLASHPTVEPYIVLGVASALSPHVHWEVAMRWTGDFLAGRPVPGWSSRAARAGRILRGEHPLDVFPERTAPKCRSFYRALAGDPTAVVLDVWGGRVAAGRPPGTYAQYRAMTAAYERVAELLAVPPRDLQARTWVFVRGRPRTLAELPPV